MITGRGSGAGASRPPIAAVVDQRAVEAHAVAQQAAAPGADAGAGAGGARPLAARAAEPLEHAMAARLSPASVALARGIAGSRSPRRRSPAVWAAAAGRGPRCRTVPRPGPAVIDEDEARRAARDGRHDLPPHVVERLFTGAASGPVEVAGGVFRVQGGVVAGQLPTRPSLVGAAAKFPLDRLGNHGLAAGGEVCCPTSGGPRRRRRSSRSSGRGPTPRRGGPCGFACPPASTSPVMTKTYSSRLRFSTCTSGTLPPGFSLTTSTPRGNGGVGRQPAAAQQRHVVDQHRIDGQLPIRGPARQSSLRPGSGPTPGRAARSRAAGPTTSPR